tara:strand:+ start:2108 stop:3064 length:957 start_codon:yes stop_codon:yes gene_type:complete
MALSKKILLILAFIANPLLLEALETDDFYSLTKPLPDSRGAINGYINNVIDKHVLWANEKKRGVSCDKMTFRVASYFLSRFRGPVNFLEKRGLLYPDTDSREEIHQETIYRDISILKSQSRHIRIGEVIFGEDKFEHFFGMGFLHYVKYRGTFKKLLRKGFSKEQARREAIKNSLPFSIYSENTFVGLWPSGIFSFADIEANIASIPFYDEICRENPILKKKGKIWSRVREFDFVHYLHPFWNEAINMNYYAPKVLPKIKPYLREYCDKMPSIKNSSFWKYSEKVKHLSLSEEFLGEMQEKLPKRIAGSFEDFCAKIK